MSHCICLHLFLVGFSIHRSSHLRVFSLLATASRTAHMTHVVVPSYIRDNMRRRSWGNCTHCICSRLCLCKLTSVIRVDLGPTPSASELNEKCLSIVYLGAIVNLIQTAISNTSESSYEHEFRVVCGLVRLEYGCHSIVEPSAAPPPCRSRVCHRVVACSSTVISPSIFPYELRAEIDKMV